MFFSRHNIMRKDKIVKLIKKAQEATKYSYAPYSKFRVGACVLSENGNFFTGCNVENCSYGLTVCAERVAIFKTISEGERPIAIAIYLADSEDYAYPCGACRQVMAEFGNLTVIIAKSESKWIEKKLDELMPLAFSPDALQK